MSIRPQFLMYSVHLLRTNQETVGGKNLGGHVNSSVPVPIDSMRILINTAALVSRSI